MQTLKSDYKRLCAVTFPDYTGAQMYMHTFRAESPEFPGLLAGYAEPVAALLRAAGIVSGDIHMTVDEKVVEAGMSQRRPGPHVDGCFYPSAQHWGHGGWNHYCNNIGGEAIQRMPVIVAASVVGCKAWRGTWRADPTSCGDLSHIPDLGDGEMLPANVGYHLSPDCIHESMRFSAPTQRQFLRLALPVNSWAGL